MPEGEEHDAQEGSQAVRVVPCRQHLGRAICAEAEKTRTTAVPTRAHVVPACAGSALRAVCCARPACTAGAGCAGRAAVTDAIDAVARTCKDDAGQLRAAQKGENRDMLGRVAFEATTSRHRPDPVIPASQSAQPSGQGWQDLPKCPAAQSSVFSVQSGGLLHDLRTAGEHALQVEPVNPSKHAHVPLPVHTPPLAHGVVQPLACTCTMLRPPLPVPPLSSPTSAIESHRTRREEGSSANWAMAQVLEVRRSDSTEVG